MITSRQIALFLSVLASTACATRSTEPSATPPQAPPTVPSDNPQPRHAELPPGAVWRLHTMFGMTGQITWLTAYQDGRVTEEDPYGRPENVVTVRVPRERIQKLQADLAESGIFEEKATCPPDPLKGFPDTGGRLLFLRHGDEVTVYDGCHGVGMPLARYRAFFLSDAFEREIAALRSADAGAPAGK